jgi:hypothetical protein
MPPTSCFFRTRFVKNPSVLLAGALLFDEKIHQSSGKCCNIWFGLWDVGILQMFYLGAVLQRTIVDISRIFGTWFGGKDCGLCTFAEEVGGLDGFLFESAQNFEVFSNIQD